MAFSVSTVREPVQTSATARSITWSVGAVSVDLAVQLTHSDNHPGRNSEAGQTSAGWHSVKLCRCPALLRQVCILSLI